MSVTIINRAKELSARGNLPDAVRVVGRWLRDNQNDYLAWICLGDLYRRTGDLDKAQRSYAKACNGFERKGRDAEVRCARARLEGLMKQKARDRGEAEAVPGYEAQIAALFDADEYTD